MPLIVALTIHGPCLPCRGWVSGHETRTGLGVVQLLFRLAVVRVCYSQVRESDI